MTGYIPAGDFWAGVFGPEGMEWGMKEGGTLWFQDLTAPDETAFFPLMVGWTHLANVEVGGLEPVVSNDGSDLTWLWFPSCSLVCSPLLLGPAPRL